MKQTYLVNGLVTWESKEIKARERMIEYLSDEIIEFLCDQNSAWKIDRIDAPILMPFALANKEYSEEDVWFTGEELCLRPETTASTYAYMVNQLRRHTGIKLPYCVWQAGKSFRVEQDKTLKNMRLKEFYQMEFQCAYAESTGNDYQGKVLEPMRCAVERSIGKLARIVTSDRLPSYSLRTMDIEVELDGRWMEVCSISKRTDFPLILPTKTPHTNPHNILVLEIALGLDRLVYAWK